MYDAASGGYKEIGIFDVQQIFGRAGRPQFDHEGEAIILTQHKQMDEYVKMMSNKQTIESNLFKGLDNCINAEISCGTIGTLTDGINWLKKSYTSSYWRPLLRQCADSTECSLSDIMSRLRPYIRLIWAASQVTITSM
jgi:replicative superfamily II helicase